MNKILAYGFVTAGLAALFWACGEGDVAVFNGDDLLMEYSIEDDDEDGSALGSLVDQAISAYCNGDLNPEACMAAARPDGKPLPASSAPDSSSSSKSSSSSAPASSFNPFPDVSSSSRPAITPVFSSSSSRPAITPVTTSSSVTARSSSSRAKSSSSSVVVIGSSSLPEDVPWGTCTANSGKPGSRGVPLKWQFSLNRDLFAGNARVLTSADYEWEFDDAEPATYKGSGTKGIVSTEVTYSASGMFAARATMTYNGQSQKVECDSVEVKGFPITGCECIPDKDEVDVAKASVESGATVVKWTVSKCKSEDKSFSYEWEKGMTPDEDDDGASASKTLDEKITYEPKVTVRNSDNGSMDVVCNAVSTVDSDHPEFEFKEQNVKIAMPAGESTVYFNMPSGWHNTNEGTCTFSCQVPTGGLLTVTINNKTSTDFYVPIQIPISSTTGMKPMKVTLSVAAECMLGW